MHSVTWLSGISFGAAVHCFLTRGVPAELGVVALSFSVFLAFASRMLRPSPRAARGGETERREG
jgi:alpha/beta superfamily hydrolase